MGFMFGGGLLCILGLFPPLIVGFAYVYFQKRLRPNNANEEVSVESGLIGGGAAGLILGLIQAIFSQILTFSMMMTQDFGPSGLPAFSFFGIGLLFGLCQSLIIGGILGAIGGAIGGAILGDS